MRKWLPHSVFAVAGWRAVGGGRVPVFDVEHWCSLAHVRRHRAGRGQTHATLPQTLRKALSRAYCVRTRAANRPDRRLEGEPGHMPVEAPACQEAATITPAYLR